MLQVNTSIGRFWSDPVQSERKIVPNRTDGLCRSIIPNSVHVHTCSGPVCEHSHYTHGPCVTHSCCRETNWKYSGSEEELVRGNTHYKISKQDCATLRGNTTYYYIRKIWLTLASPSFFFFSIIRRVHVYAQSDRIVLSLHVNSWLRFSRSSKVQIGFENCAHVKVASVNGSKHNNRFWLSHHHSQKKTQCATGGRHWRGGVVMSWNRHKQ